MNRSNECKKMQEICVRMSVSSSQDFHAPSPDPYSSYAWSTPPFLWVRIHFNNYGADDCEIEEEQGKGLLILFEFILTYLGLTGLDFDYQEDWAIFGHGA
jgi:hypothetical protein